MKQKNLLKALFSVALALLMVLTVVPLNAETDNKASAPDPAAEDPSDTMRGDYSSTTLSSMVARAEALVNYRWTPSTDIATWNGSSYYGSTIFTQSSTVVGVPYTLFTSEVVSWSLCSLEQYMQVAAINYSATAYCSSSGATRTGPVYGSCCADLVCEVLGGNYMDGNSPRYHNVVAIRNSSYGTTIYGQKMSDIRAGDALSDYPNHNHIIWIGDVTVTTITVYEQTPPVARKRVLNKSSYTDSSGYFVYGNKQYSVITRSNAFIDTPAGPPEAPQNVHTDKYLYSCNEYIPVYWDASIGATDYWVYMWKDGVELYSNDVGTNLSFTSAPTSAGLYTLIVRAGNSYGYSNGPASVTFRVYDSAPEPPPYVATSSGRYLFSCEESIEFEWGASELATDYWIYMWKDGEQIYSTDVGTNLSFTSAPTSAGLYTLIVRAGNEIGYSNGPASVTFRVYDSAPEPPSYVATSSGRYLFSCEESIELEWGASALATEYRIYMWKDGVELYSTDVGTNLSFTSAPTSAGLYTLIVRAGNKFGYSDGTASVSFRVCDTVPSEPTVQTDKQNYMNGETVYISWNGSLNCQYYMLNIYKDGELYADQRLEADALAYAMNSVSEGNYTVYLTAHNMYGDSTSYCSFVVSSPACGDVDCDGQVTAADALLAMRHAMSITTVEGQGFINGDMDGDGRLTASDAVLIMRQVMNIG